MVRSAQDVHHLALSQEESLAANTTAAVTGQSETCGPTELAGTAALTESIATYEALPVS